jgi:hypothetical protein
MFRYLFVGGHYGKEAKPSGYVKKLYEIIHGMNPNGLLINGGKFQELKRLINSLVFANYDVIFWMPDIPNNKEKLVRKIKPLSPHTLLVTSKNNIEGKYQFMELIARALQVKANLFVEFTHKLEIGYVGNVLAASVYDPLGNRFCEELTDITQVAITLMDRIQKLLRYTRLGSECLPYSWPGKRMPDPEIQKEFYTLIRDYADIFHKCIHSMNQSRLLGNASFRCERGFPSFKDGNNQIYVSQRNIDKRHINPDGFVPVYLVFNDSTKEVTVGYRGDHNYVCIKPSVDAPVHLMLYHYYHNIKYMIHSHTYIRHAPFTTERIPCGAIEEFYEIIKLCPEREHSYMILNLRGHGSLVMATEIKRLRSIEYYPRSTPENA